MEEHALWLLDEVREFVEQCVHSGFQLSAYANDLHENVNRVHDYLRKTQRVDEASGPRPRQGLKVTVPISLEALSVYPE